jgi:hypothetical protein
MKVFNTDEVRAAIAAIDKKFMEDVNQFWVILVILGTRYLIMVVFTHGKISKGGIGRIPTSYYSTRQSPSGCIF